MKKLLSAGLALVVVLSMVLAALPAFADDLDPMLITKAKVTPGSHAPVIEGVVELAGTNTTQPSDRNFMPSPAPKLSQICIYAVVSDPAGNNDITAAYADILHPDGSLKIQIHQVRWGHDQYAAQTAIINAGVVKGQLTRARADELLWMLDPAKNQATFWAGCFDYEVHQPAGNYTVSEWAIDLGSGRSNPVNQIFHILPFVSIDIDFSQVDFGIVTAGIKKVVAGDETFAMNDGRPTVWNKGNVNASLAISNTAMLGVQFGKSITRFDAQLEEQYVEYNAGEIVHLSGPLEPCEPEQIEFSVLPPIDLAPDDYCGKIFIRIYPS